MRSLPVVVMLATLRVSTSMNVPAPRAPQLNVLRDIAKVKATLSRVQTAWSPGASVDGDLGLLYSALQKETEALVADLRTFERALEQPPEAPPPNNFWPRWTSTMAPGRFEENSRYERELNALRIKASGLHAQVDKQREQIALLEEAEVSATSRAQLVFDAMDTNGDGSICLAEFTDAASMFSIGEAELERRFYQADEGSDDGVLDFDEFASFLSDLRGDSIGPLRAARAAGLGALLETTLEMASLSLARELTAAATDGGRATELSACVDRWCDLEKRSREPIELASGSSSDGGGSGSGGGGDEDDGGGAEAQLDDAQQADRLESLLLEVGELATDLALTNVTATVEWSVRRSARLLAAGARASIGFCVRGLRITWGDVVESCGLLARALFRGRALLQPDVSLIKRTVFDCLMLVPYAIIMIIPLSPPGHVFAFSVLNRVFPGAVPSGFTAQRQDIDELYARIAAEATEKPMLSPMLRLPAMTRVSRVAKRAVRRLGGRPRGDTQQLPTEAVA